MWLGFGTAMLVLAVGSAAFANPCRDAPAIPLPIEHLLSADYIDMKFTAMSRVDYDNLTSVEDVLSMPDAAFWPDVVAERAALLPIEARDLPYLIIAAELDRYPEPIALLTTLAESELTPELVLVFGRHGLFIQANALRRAMALFPVWGSSPAERYRQVYADNGTLTNPALQDMLKALNAPYKAASPTATDAALALIGHHPTIKAAYDARLRAATDEDRLGYLTGLLWADCMTNWWTPAEADAAFATLGVAQRDILLMDYFLAESYNGSVHQFFSNSSGTLAPDLATLLDRLSLPEHAKAVRTGMAVFPEPYPRNTDARRTAMSRFSAAQDEQLYDLTVWADDGLIYDAMVKRARDAGILPK